MRDDKESWSLRNASFVFMFLVCYAFVFCSASEKETVRVFSTISVLTEPNEPERVPGAVVWFQMSDRRSVGAKTNQDGRYETLLEPGYEYAVTAGGQQLCDIHRPIFKPKPGSVLRFDFTTTGCGIIDRIVVPAPPDMDPNILDAAPLSPAREMKRNDNRPGYRPYYHSDHDPKAPYWFFEESLPDGNEDRWVAIAFGERGETNGIVTYGPFSLARHIHSFRRLAYR